MISRNAWVWATFASAVSSAGHVAPAAASPDPSRVYSSVRYIEEAGDDVGMEVEVITKPRPAAVVTICEGECWGGRTWPPVITGRQISFSVVEKLTDWHGKPAKLLTLNFVGRFEGDALIIKNRVDVPTERLRRVVDPIPGQTAQLGCANMAQYRFCGR